MSSELTWINAMGLYHTFSEMKGDFGRKLAFVSTPAVYLTTSLMGFLSESCNVEVELEDNDAPTRW